MEKQFWKLFISYNVLLNGGTHNNLGQNGEIDVYTNKYIGWKLQWKKLLN